MVRTAAIALLFSGCNWVLGLERPGGDDNDPVDPALRLASLELSSGSLVPPFDPDVADYQLDLGIDVAGVLVTATAEDTASTVAIDGRPASDPVAVDLALGDNLVEVVVSDGDLEQTYTIASTRGGLDAYVKASNADPADFFGGVAASGNTLVVATTSESSTGDPSDNSAPNAGAVYVFVRDGDGWREQAYLKPAVIGAGDRFGSSVAIDGDTLVVGATAEDSDAIGIDGPADNQLASNAGAAYVFVRTGESWSQQAFVKASNTGAGDRFGSSIAISGDTLAVGAFVEDSSAAGVGGDQTSDDLDGPGAVYVFTRDGTTWTQQAYIKASNPDSGDQFGGNLALDGDILVVRASLEDSAGAESDNTTPDSGAVYVFVRTGDTWAQEAYLKAPDISQNAQFGGALAVSAETGTIAATAQNTGSVHIFVRSGSTWPLETTLSGSSDDNFGSGVALAGDRLVVGAFRDSSAATGIFDAVQTDEGAPLSGAAYLFSRTDWSLTAYLKAPNGQADDSFGQGVAATPEFIAVGAPLEDGSAGIDGNPDDNNAINSGAIYVFR